MDLPLVKYTCNRILGSFSVFKYFFGTTKIVLVGFRVWCKRHVFFLLSKTRCVGKDWAHQTSHLLLSCCHNVALNKCKSQHSWITLWSNYAVSRKQGHITIPELVKKLAVPPEKRTNYECGLIADALYVFISSIAPFKEGLCIPWCFYTHSFTSGSFVALPCCAPCPAHFLYIEFAQDLWSRMRLQ